jgi:cation diffusion facilitator family transporter
MTSIADFSEDRALADPERYRIAQRTTWVSAGVNLLLTILQLLVGWLAHSQSLIAHGVHSFSDLLSDFLVLYANRQGSSPADKDHPYGHARIETAATLILGVSLCAVGGGILWDALIRLQAMSAGSALPPIELVALWVAIATVLFKEALYRYLIRVARRLNSKLMAANALHTRADAASALVVVAGVGGALAGWPALDLVAALLMGFMILRLGIVLAWAALRELIDEGLDEEHVNAIRATLDKVPGLVGVHDLRTRRMAHQVLVDVHALVSPKISVSEGHFIAESARIAVLRANPEILDVLVHVDPEDDHNYVGGGCTIPPRRALESILQGALAGLPAPESLIFHYLGGRVEAEIRFDCQIPADRLAAAEKALAEVLETHPCFASVRVSTLMHQNKA